MAGKTVGRLTNAWRVLLDSATEKGFSAADVDEFLVEGDKDKYTPSNFERLSDAIARGSLYEPQPDKPIVMQNMTGAGLELKVGKETMPMNVQPDEMLKELMQQDGMRPPGIKDMDPGKFQINPMALPPDAKKLEQKKRFKFAWLPWKDEQQLAQLHAKHGAGYYLWVRRIEFETYMPKANWSKAGAIQNGDSMLAFMDWSVWEALQKQKDQDGLKRAVASQRGEDAQGRIGGNMVVATGNIGPDDGTEFTLPNQPGLTNEKGEEIAPVFHSS